MAVDSGQSNLVASNAPYWVCYYRESLLLQGLKKLDLNVLTAKKVAIH